MPRRLPPRGRAGKEEVERGQLAINMEDVADRLRDLLDLVLASLDDPGADGRALAGRAHFSRDHLDRLLASATGETPVALRRRLLLERAAWSLRTGPGGASDAAEAAGYGSLAAFSRAFARAYGMPPSAFAGSSAPVALPAPNGIHFHPPAGFVLPGRPRPAGVRGVTDRLLGHHLAHTRALLAAVDALLPEQLERPLRPGFVVVWFEGEEASVAVMAERLVYTLEVWVAAVEGAAAPRPGAGDRLARFEPAARAFSRLVRAIGERSGWEDAFVDALCEPPQSFTYGGVVAHVLEYGAIRRHALAGALRELGVGVEFQTAGDPIMWEPAPERARSAPRLGRADSAADER